jgi:hypothetical protein
MMLRLNFNTDENGVRVDVSGAGGSGAKTARAALYVAAVTLLLTIGFWGAVFGPAALQQAGLVVNDTGGDPGSQALTPVGRRTKIDGTLLTDYFVAYEDGEIRDVLTTDTIDEYTSAGGVTIDGLTLKDSGFAEAVYIDGASDTIQLRVQGYTTQTNDLFVLENSSGTDQFTVDNSGNATATGDVSAVGVTASGNITGSGDVTVSGADADITLGADSSGGNAGARNEIQGLPRLKMVALGTGTDGSAETVNYLDDSPTGEWSEDDAGTNLAVSADTSIYRVGSNSLQIAFTSVVTGDGATGTAGAQDDLSANESIGFWLYADSAITAGDFSLTVDDSDGTDQVYTSTIACDANVWTWIEVDISGCDGNCDTMDNIVIDATGQGAANHTGALNIYLDAMYKWDADDEEALSTAILQDGVLGIMASTTISTSANTAAMQTAWTDYFSHYESGNDFIVWITDESATSNVALLSY